MSSVSVTLDLDYLHRKDWWSRVEVRTSDECWPWLKSTGSHGYGQTWDGHHVCLAHRVAWSLHHWQQIDDGMTIDHTCHNRTCCNPAHLRVLSNLANASDQGQRAKTHCPHGHPYKGTNLYVDPRGHHRCRTCAHRQVLT